MLIAKYQNNILNLLLFINVSFYLVFFLLGAIMVLSLNSDFQFEFSDQIETGHSSPQSCYMPTVNFRVTDPEPNWIRIQSDQWIRIRNPDPDPGGQKSVGCFLLRAEGFFCNLDVFYESLGIGKL